MNPDGVFFSNGPVSAGYGFTALRCMLHSQCPTSCSAPAACAWHSAGCIVSWLMLLARCRAQGTRPKLPTPAPAWRSPLPALRRNSGHV